MDEAISNLRRYNRHSGMLIIDIDFFKHFNDTYGHLCGDKVLVALATTLRKIVRENDCVARFGGEEFSILLTECDENSLWSIAERIRLAVKDIVLYEKDQKLSITISVGGCLIHDIKGVTPNYVFKKADKALYCSKQHGRNRTTIYSMGFLDAAKIKNGEDLSEEG